jgi:glycosyltransferase involved in cell wall biosynthesis
MLKVNNYDGYVPSSSMLTGDEVETGHKRGPRASIGMPVFNGEKYLAQSIESMLAQTFEDFELIISDNGSQDETEAICRRYASRDRRIRYLRHEVNRGAAWNHNFVFATSSGEYFKWQPHDDVCEPTFVEK